ncbi:copper amine oxidase N-terminal domain-containing protein [Sporosarcina sp. ACRSM]|uniref:DUF6612 family protein n=1 Tax=Sporosarcina sp. ACRSM TaxID=2918216 RepID=UPI001EF6E67D|nr:DUF6612 family protein [Sporosarcina sp. ACRSM]MCG7336526.1 copper amine oxidase N-terminal domain-containing protein [Sporosarcina sp. ACRSM]
MKKLATWALAFILLLSFAFPQDTASAQSYALNWTIDDVEVTGNDQPFLFNDKVLIPIEKLFEEVGFKVSKDESGKVHVTNNHLTIDFDAAAGEIKVNGEKANAEFPLTDRNGGNYISTEFLAQLEGFSAKVAADHQSVAIQTNRVLDVPAFLEKAMDANLNSQSANLTIDLEMASSLDEETMKMLMAIQSDDILDPFSSHSISTMSMTDSEGFAFEEVSETYITEDGFFQKMGDTWIKYDDEMAEFMQQITSAQEMLLPQLEELQQKFTTGINIYEYDDVYVMTQSLTTDELKEMLKEASSLFSELLPVMGTEEVSIEVIATEAEEIEEVTLENEVTEEVTAEEAKEETVVEAVDDETTTEENTNEATEEEAVIDEVIFEEGDFDAIFDSLGLQLEEFYFVSNYDKETLFPLDLSGNAHITMAMGEDSFSMKMILSGAFSNFNAVEEIKVPEEVIQNAITMEEYFEQLEAEFEAEFEYEAE